MTEFLKTEFLRLLDKLPETDPTSVEYQCLLQSIGYLDGMGEQIDALVSLREGCDGQLKMIELDSPMVDNVIPFEAAVAKEAAPTPAPVQEHTYTLADVRTALRKAKAQGVDLVQLFEEYGATNATNLPESSYAEIMQLYGD